MESGHHGYKTIKLKFKIIVVLYPQFTEFENHQGLQEYKVRFPSHRQIHQTIAYGMNHMNQLTQKELNNMNQELQCEPHGTLFINHE